MKVFSRCRCSPLTAIVLIASNFILPSIAASSGATLFNIPTGSDAGSCDAHDIDDIISEAEKMANAAITAITNYQAASILSTSSQAVLNTYEAAFAMFGAEGTKLPLVNRVSITSSGSAILENVKKNYQKVIDLLNSGKNIGGTNPAVLACDESFLTWVVKLEDMNANLKGNPAGQITIASEINKQNPLVSAYTAGFYYSKWKGSNILIQDEGVKKPDGSPGGGLCSQQTMKAETWAKYGFMLCCPAMFNLVPSLAGFAAAQDKITKGTNIETYLSQPGAFLHEMMHFLDLNTATGAKIIDQVNNGQKVYTWTPCSILGTNAPDAALLNADNYHYFAVASYLGNVNFGTDGIAQ